LIDKQPNFAIGDRGKQTVWQCSMRHLATAGGTFRQNLPEFKKRDCQTPVFCYRATGYVATEKKSYEQCKKSPKD
jgi:hypothetical protein